MAIAEDSICGVCGLGRETYHVRVLTTLETMNMAESFDLNDFKLHWRALRDRVELCESVIAKLQHEFAELHRLNGVCCATVDAVAERSETDPEWMSPRVVLPHKWKVGDLCYVVFQQSRDDGSDRCWNVFFDEAAADAFVVACGFPVRPVVGVGPRVRKSLAQVTAVDVLSNRVLSFREDCLIV
jgi:hypothetical protein